MQTPVNTREELFKLIQLNSKSILACGVLRIGVFGSFARDEATKTSDVDFMIEFDPGKANLKNLVDLGDLLESITLRKVELVSPQSLSKYIGPYIMKEVQYVSLAA